ncbi:unnamed protein product [Allacma fusca]|uniref:C2H2-type domain-containing protein n=1 Tax=Allacma fusca TaxID=39272 RepID=A0A8J2LNT7_9HEXA|nr:unnamed protein product [Allacma fusca]
MKGMDSLNPLSFDRDGRTAASSEDHLGVVEILDGASEEESGLNLKSAMEDVMRLKLQCQFCSEVMIGIVKMNKHLKKAHRAKIRINCNLCGMIFKRNRELVKHLQEHGLRTLPGTSRRNKFSGEEKEKGEDIGSLLDSGELDRAYKSDDPPGLTDDGNREHAADPLVDNECEDWFNDYPYLSTELQGIPSPSSSPSEIAPASVIEDVGVAEVIPCCTKKAVLGNHDSEYGLAEAEKTDSVLQQQVYQFPCPNCDLIFKTHELASIHSTYHTLQINVKFRCSTCNKYFDNPTDYQRHASNGHKKKNSPAFQVKNISRRYPINSYTENSNENLFVENDTQIYNGKTYKGGISPKQLSVSSSLPANLVIHPPAHLPDHEVQIKIEPGECQGQSGDGISVPNMRKDTFTKQSALRNKPKPRRRCVACPVCKKLLRGKCDLAMHMVTHTKERNFKCPKCLKTFSAQSSALRHLKTFHDPKASEKNKFWCKQCSRSYLTALELQSHLRYHKRKGKYACNVCERKFNCSSHVTAHMRVHLTERPFKCSKCGKSFMQQCELTRHEKTHLRLTQASTLPSESSSFRNCKKSGPSNGKPFICLHCGKRYSHQRTLNIHLPTHTEFAGYICTRCGKELPSKDLLEIHLSQHPPKELGPCICEICGKSYASQYNLRAHMERNSTETFQCDVCGKMCKTKNDLKFHSYIHLPTKPFPCKFCDYRCSQPSLAQHHMLTSHFGPNGFRENDKNGKARTFICEVCSEGFSNAACLTQHQHYHDDKKTVKCKKPNCDQYFHTRYDLLYHVKVSHRKKYQCQDCDKVFAGKASLDMHRRYAHTGETPFGCTYCDKRFKSRGDLAYHIATHTGNYKFTCEVCGKKCITKGNMNVHMRTHMIHSCNKCGVPCASANALKKHRCSMTLKFEAETDLNSDSFCPKTFPVKAFSNPEEVVPAVSSVCINAPSTAVPTVFYSKWAHN